MPASLSCAPTPTHNTQWACQLAQIGRRAPISESEGQLSFLGGKRKGLHVDSPERPESLSLHDADLSASHASRPALKRKNECQLPAVGESAKPMQTPEDLKLLTHRRKHLTAELERWDSRHHENFERIEALIKNIYLTAPYHGGQRTLSAAFNFQAMQKQALLKLEDERQNINGFTDNHIAEWNEHFPSEPVPHLSPEVIAERLHDVGTQVVALEQKILHAKKKIAKSKRNDPTLQPLIREVQDHLRPSLRAYKSERAILENRWTLATGGLPLPQRPVLLSGSARA